MPIRKFKKKITAQRRNNGTEKKTNQEKRRNAY
jgi:hypothetical protein